MRFGDFIRLLLSKRGGGTAFLLLCFALVPLFASNVLWSWDSQEDVKYFRYQLNGEVAENWTVVDGFVTSVLLPSQNGDVIYVQSSIDGVNWSPSGNNIYIKEKSSLPLELRFNLTPYNLDIYDFYNGHEAIGSRAVSSSLYGFNIDLELDWNFASAFRFYPEFSYALGVKPEPVLPNAKIISYLKLGAGFEYLLQLSQPDILTFGLFGGALTSINNKKISITPYFGARLGYQRVLTEHLTLSAFTRVSLSFYKTNEALYDSLTIFLEPVCVGISYNFGGAK